MNIKSLAMASLLYVSVAGCAMIPTAPSAVTAKVPNTSPERAINRLAASFAKGATAGFIIVSSTPTQLVIEKLGDKQVPAFSRSTGNVLPDTPTGRMTFTAIQSGRDTLLTLHAQTIHFPGTAMQEIEEANDPALAEVAQAAAKLAAKDNGG